ncbi:hypothetical protein C2857_002088 [Epichloe festucae Fl1]|uniref:WW domain-containing protein n=1 Tax=Epichloe festucae (strain Fl1) TaxID=877507 RepID=A0A7U3Q016_EPIFF|nr:hypothetical protein C2857_002088 [Epichloe festucae Fl1]
MLRSTYKPSAAAAAAAAPLPPGWTEHTAPTGHKYYYHSETKESTYQRPGAPAVAPEPAQDSYSPYSHLPSLADPRVANAYLAQLNPQSRPQNRDGHGRRGRGGYDGRPRPQPHDKPRRAEKIPGCEPWMLVYTKYSRRFAYNPVKKASYWRIPDKLARAILELDTARIREKASGDSGDAGGKKDGQPPSTREEEQPKGTHKGTYQDTQRHDDDSDEYEEVEVEVTDEEGDDPDNSHAPKRRRTGAASEGGDEEPNEDDRGVDFEYEHEQDGQGHGAVEFTEADIAAQLQAMGEEYGLEPGDYDDGNMEEWPEGTAGLDFSQDDAKLLFKDLLNDFHVNPYSPWEKLLEEGKIIHDPRYTALTTTRARKDCWDEWTREKISHLKDQRAKQERKDPKIAYLALLQEKATPKLYWPEFKRKYKKEDAMRDTRLSDKEREKAYREYVARSKMPQATLKSDLMTLLRAQSPRHLHNKSSLDNLPTQVLTDIRFVSLNPTIRDALIEAYIQTLAGPPSGDASATAVEDDEERRKAGEAREKRERALEERNRAVEEQRRRRERDLAAGKARLREEERELELAMRVGKRGLQSQLASGEAGG